RSRQAGFRSQSTKSPLKRAPFQDAACAKKLRLQLLPPLQLLPEAAQRSGVAWVLGGGALDAQVVGQAAQPGKVLGQRAAPRRPVPGMEIPLQKPATGLRQFVGAFPA